MPHGVLTEYYEFEAVSSGRRLAEVNDTAGTLTRLRGERQ